MGMTFACGNGDWPIEDTLNLGLLYEVFATTGLACFNKSSAFPEDYKKFNFLTFDLPSLHNYYVNILTGRRCFQSGLSPYGLA